MIVDIRVKGIPCQAHVTRFFVQEPLGQWADSDWDANGYTEIEWDLLDTRGRPAAKWLEDKLDPKEIERIEEELIEAMLEGDD